MEAIYKNGLGSILTSQQVTLMDRYFIHFTQNSILKEIHRIDKNYDAIPLHIDYYINENEDPITVKNQLAERTNSFSIVFTSTYQDCQIHDHKDYFDGEHTGNHKILYRNNLEICWQLYLVSGEPELEHTEKYYYDNNGDQKLWFSYNEEGTVSTVTGEPPFEPYDNHITALSYNEFNFYNPDFLSENPYYIDATFLPE